ncbi:helix-turn-helix domain-containing protein [Bradyrhizobium sp. ISRA443]|uniref:helix-turn-helix domain-containing protein n=1 Tax=unclassified Bradyrhizobium TaxID=2631580 RepID=UPI00247867AD|nr:MULTISPECIES: helix-turn-helix domain-containing protein [unclassified Bradyrhizobium]WGR99309.1 helix-turn-helix domain-containing protein [Bradyrhizobium sp. ISRA436]WGS06201.1 helix-turn-helix domain-containing protein [Bradyrhizobium sp. ISRA437]WGS13086.1 helix-turn-helix domain-containing protein [Bradyrhizobium sp. ISRA443]
MTLAAFELCLRSATVALLLVLAALLFSDFRKVLAGRLAIGFALGSAAHAVTASIGAAPSQISAWHAPLIALSTGNIVVFWLLTRALFDDAFTLRPWHGLIWAAVSAFSLVNCLWIAPGGHAPAAIVTINLIVLGFIALAVVQTFASWSADLVERRRRVRVFIVAAAALYGGLNALLQIAIAGSGVAADWANAINAAVLAGIVAAIAYAMMRVDAADLFAAAVEAVTANAPPAAVEDAADQKLVDALMRLMADERIYRQDNITIGTLASRLKIPEYRLRRLINQRLGYRNFNVFLNNHRIEEAKAALADPAQAEVPVITIAMDAGFKSLGPFNRAFKATTGVTPTEYRRLKLNAV